MSTDYLGQANGTARKNKDCLDDNIEDACEEIEEKTKSTDATIKKPRRVQKLSLAETEDFNAKLKKRGVLYVARVPPRMTPTKIKSLLSNFGEVTRVYLVEEDASVRKRRKKEFGGSGGKRYIEGWVEFSSKKKAKHIAESLNSTPISNHKRNPHYGTLWNLKYLSKFKWSHLTEKVAYERRVREQKLRVEMMQARRENAAYVEMVETGKKLDKIEERKRKRGGESVTDDINDRNSSHGMKENGRRNKLHQRKPVKDKSDKPAKLAILGGLV